MIWKVGIILEFMFILKFVITFKSWKEYKLTEIPVYNDVYNSKRIQRDYK